MAIISLEEIEENVVIDDGNYKEYPLEEQIDVETVNKSLEETEDVLESMEITHKEQSDILDNIENVTDDEKVQDLSSEAFLKLESYMTKLTGIAGKNISNVFINNKFNKTLTHESIRLDPLGSLKITHEGLGDAIKKVYEKIKQFIRSIIEKISKLFTSIKKFFLGKKNKETETKISKLENNAEVNKNDKEIKALVGSKTSSKKDDNDLHKEDKDRSGLLEFEPPYFPAKESAKKYRLISEVIGSNLRSINDAISSNFQSADFTETLLKDLERLDCDDFKNVFKDDVSYFEKENDCSLLYVLPGKNTRYLFIYVDKNNNLKTHSYVISKTIDSGNKDISTKEFLKYGKDFIKGSDSIIKEQEKHIATLKDISNKLDNNKEFSKENLEKFRKTLVFISNLLANSCSFTGILLNYITTTVKHIEEASKQ